MRVYAKQKGFTIVELLIVIVVIGILAAITIVAYNGIQNRANDAAVQSDLQKLKTKFEVFNADNSRYPSGDNEVATAASPFKATKGSYAVSPVTSHNLIYCRESTSQIFGVAAQSKSGNKYYITNASGVSVYTGAWTDQATICANVNASLISNFRGYAAEDTTNGPWRSWAGGN